MGIQVGYCYNKYIGGNRMVRKKVIGLFLSGLLFAISTPVYADVHVDGYSRKDGTYVPPHYRSDPDGNFNNNWSTKGNVNPYTGQEGTKTHPEYSSGSGYSVQSPVQVPPT